MESELFRDDNLSQRVRSHSPQSKQRNKDTSQADSNQIKPVIVLGAGASGLGAALGIQLYGGKNSIKVIEKKIRPGGLAGSFQWNGHTIDFGPHRLSPNLEPIRVLAEEILGTDCLTKKSLHGVQFKGKLYQFPPRVLDWITPRSFYLLAKFGLSFLYAKLAWITWRFKSDDFKSIMIRKFGRLFHREIAAPMAEKVWTKPDNIDPNFANQRFTLIHPSSVIKKIIFPKQDYNPSYFYYPRKGFQQLWDRMAEYTIRDGAHIHYGWWPKLIEVEQNRIQRLILTDGKQEIIEQGPDLTVVSSIPIASFVNVLKGYREEELKKRVQKLNVRSILLIALEFDQEKTLPYRTLIYPEQAYCFNRLFEQNEYSRETVTPGKSVVVADITLHRTDPLYLASDESIIELVKRDLFKLSYIPKAKLLKAHVERVPFAYVVPDHETRSEFQAIHQELKKISNLILVGRFAIGEYDNSDYAIDHGLSIGGLISGRIPKIQYLTLTHQKRNRVIVG